MLKILAFSKRELLLYLPHTFVRKKVFFRAVKLYADLGIKVVPFGTAITREQFDEIETKAGKSKTYPIGG